MNRAAWQRRHKFGVDWRLLLLIGPLLAFGAFGIMWNLSMLWVIVAACAVWFIGKVQWTIDPWLIDRWLIQLFLPRCGSAVRTDRAPSRLLRFVHVVRQRIGR